MATGPAWPQPAANAAKAASKQRVLRETLGYEPEGQTRIDYVPDIGDFKTAWDLVTFGGFLGTPMRLEFTWHGCDSALAAPLVLDLARLDRGRPRGRLAGPGRAARRSSSRTRSATAPHALADQWRVLCDFVAALPAAGAHGGDDARLRDLVELIRAPAALSVPGDAVAGAAAAGPARAAHGRARRRLGLPLLGGHGRQRLVRPGARRDRTA